MHGNELVLGAIFGVWLSGTGLGALAGTRARLPGRALPWLILALALLPLPIVPVLRLSRWVLSIPPGEYLSFPAFLLLLLITALPCPLIAGFIFPQGARSLPPDFSPARGIGRIYTAESLGSLAAGISFTFILLHFFDPLTILGINLFLCFFVFSWALPLRLRYFLPGALLLFLLISLLPRLNSWLAQAGIRDLVPISAYLGSRDTPYARLALASSRGQTVLYVNGEPSLNFPDPEENAKKAGYILAQHPHPESLLLIGNGTGGLIRALLGSPLRNLDYLEPDRQAFDFLLPFLPPEEQAVLEDHRVRIVFRDARDFFNSTSDGYDLIYLNLSDPHNAGLNRFFTREFFSQAKDHLHPGGVLGFSLSSSENYPPGEAFSFFDSVYKSLKTVFPEVVASPGPTSFVFAGSSPSPVSSDPEVLGGRLSRLIPAPEGLVPSEFYSLFPPDRTRELENRLGKTAGPENLDSRPATYLANLILWDRFSDSHLSPLIRFFQGRGIYYLLLALVILAGGYFLTRARARLHPAPAAVFLLGFALMGASVFWLYLFQNLAGTLYQKIGLLNALFMLGLALGAGVISRRLNPGGKIPCHPAGLLLAAAAIVLVMAILPPEGLPVWISKTAVFLGIFLTGFCGGAVFPLAADLYLHTPGHPEPGKAGGLLDAADLFGSALGGFLCGPFLLPVLGMPRSALIISGLLVLAAFLFLDRRSKPLVRSAQC